MALHDEEPVVLEPCIQKSTNDCTIACLSMYLGKPYAEVRQAAGRRLGKDGMGIPGIIATAKKLKVMLFFEKDFDSDDVGIVSLTRTDESDGHVVVFVRGVVWTPASGQLWTDLHTYCRVHHFTVDGLITRRKSGE